MHQNHWKCVCVCVKSFSATLEVNAEMQRVIIFTDLVDDVIA
jgi:hypothetical protein